MLIGAGAESTTSIIQTFFKIMALQQDVMKKAQEGIYVPSNFAIYWLIQATKNWIVL
jgi:hypothetical protein